MGTDGGAALEGWVFILLGLLATLIAAWAGFILALSLRGRMRRLEDAVRLLERAAAAHAPAAQPASAPEAPAEPEPAEPAPVAEAPAAPPKIEPQTGRPSWYPPDEPAPAAPRRRRESEGVAALFRELERSLAGNWLVWVAGAALALGGVLLAKYALDQGLLGPWARIALAALAGAAMLAAGEWLRRRPERAGAARSLAPAVLSAAGLITLYGDVYAGFAAFDLIPGPVAFALLAAIAAFALFLAWLHGPVIAAFGIAGGFAAPILIGADEPNAAGLFAYVFAVTAASLAVARFARWRWTAWLSLAGGAGWPALWLMGAFDPAQALALAVYLPALAAVAVAFAWDEAQAPPPMRRLLPAAWNFAPPSALAAHACFAAALALSLWLLAAWSYSVAAAVSLGLLCAFGLAAAWRREGFALLPLFAAVAATLALYWWPDALAAASLAEAAAQQDSTDARRSLTPVLPAAVALMAVFGAGGLFAQRRLSLKGPMATAAAGAPVAILIVMAFKLGGPEVAPLWGVLLGLAAAAELALVEMLARGGRDRESPGQAAAYALGACAAALGAVIVLLDQVWIGAGMAAEAAAAAWLVGRWRSPALVWASALLGLAAVYQLTLGADYLLGWTGGPLAAAFLVLAYVLAVAGLDGASRLLRRAGLRREGAAVRTLDGAAVALAVTAAFIALRLVLNGGSLTGRYGLVEMGLQSGLWLAVPLTLRLRVSGGLTMVQRVAEMALIALAALHVLWAQMLIANPWIGLDAQPVGGPPIVNPLLVAYALPAVLTGALAMLWRRRGYRSAPWAAAGAAALFFVWITLETRRAFHAPDLSLGAVGDIESWAYSTVWLVGAGLVMAWGVVRRTPILRYIALVALTLTTLKVFLFDLAGLEGLWRALSFLGLGAALMAIAVIYQRVVLPGERPDSPEAPDALGSAP